MNSNMAPYKMRCTVIQSLLKYAEFKNGTFTVKWMALKRAFGLVFRTDYIAPSCQDPAPSAEK